MYVSKIAWLIVAIFLQIIFARQPQDSSALLLQRDSLHFSIIPSIFADNKSPEPLSTSFLDSLSAYIAVLVPQHKLALAPINKTPLHTPFTIPFHVTSVFKNQIILSKESAAGLLNSGIQQIGFFYNPICKAVERKSENTFMQSRDFNPITSSHERQAQSLSQLIPTHSFEMTFAICDVKSGSILYTMHADDVNTNVSDGLYEITDKLLYMVASELMHNKSRFYRCIKSIVWHSRRP